MSYTGSLAIIVIYFFFLLKKMGPKPPHLVAHMTFLCKLESYDLSGKDLKHSALHFVKKNY